MLELGSASYWYDVCFERGVVAVEKCSMASADFKLAPDYPAIFALRVLKFFIELNVR
jgi:hypothetical protein